MIAREQKRRALVAKYYDKRKQLKTAIKSSPDMNDVVNAQEKLAKLPVNSNPSRCNSRCNQCGRPRSIYKKFGLCRLCLRQQLMNGNVAGGRKSSW